MTLVMVRDRQEIYDRLTQARQQQKQQLQPPPPASISVRAPGLDERARNELQADIQAVLDRTVQRMQSDRQQTAVIAPPTNDQIRETALAFRDSLQRREPEGQQRRPGNGGIRVVTDGLSLPLKHRRAFHSEVRQLVQERLDGLGQAQIRPQVWACGCPPLGLPTCCWPPPGALGDLTQIPPPAPAREDQPWTVGLFFDGQPPFIGGDTIEMQVWIDPRWAINPPDQVSVGLRINPAVEPGQWAKEITGWASCYCAVQDIQQEGPTTDYAWMQISQETVDTLAFRKAVFLGWHNSGFFGPTPAAFWNYFGGLSVTFDWIAD